MYSASVGIGGMVGSRPIWSYSFVDPPPQLDKVQIEAIELVFGEDNALDEATSDSRDKVFATTMVQQFDKTFRQRFAVARTEVQIIEN